MELEPQIQQLLRALPSPASMAGYKLAGKAISKQQTLKRVMWYFEEGDVVL